jgi:hypothetical protein
MNYFIDTSSLTIVHQNQYSAIETATLMPVYGIAWIEKFVQENNWIKRFLPNSKNNLDEHFLLKKRKQPVKSFFENLANLLFPEQINLFFMEITDKKWRRKWSRKEYDPQDYEKAFYTSLHISKNHPVDYEKKVLKALKNTEKQ